ncbi:MAG: site-specific integrase [Opitutaceae bacterium]
MRWKSLETIVFSTAQQRLLDEQAKALAQRWQPAPANTGKIYMADVMKTYRERVEGNQSFRPATVKARKLAMDRIPKTWPGFEKLEPKHITAQQVFEWVNRLKTTGTGFAPPLSRGPSAKTRGTSATTVNQSLDTLRRLMNIAIEVHAIPANPVSSKLPEGMGNLRVSVRAKPVHLPSKEHFRRMVEEIRSSGSGWAYDAADLVQFLAFSGARKGEAMRLTWGHANFSKKQLRIPGTKSESSNRVVPMIAPLVELLEAIKVRRRQQGDTVEAGDRILKLTECQKSIDRACGILAIPRMTHHDLRHLFATVCIESAVDIPTVARWLGHKDGGALAMKTYGHLRDDHSQQQAEKVEF